MTKVLVTESSLEDIADAIRAKNGGAATYTPGDMATAITNLPSGGGADLNEYFESSPETMQYPSSWTVKEYLKKAPNLTIPSGRTDALFLFQGWQYSFVPKVITHSSFTSYNHFYGNQNSNGCANVTSFDLSGIDTTSATSYSYMFCGCKSVVSLDLSGFDFSRVTGYNNSSSIYNFFDTCTALTNLTFGTGLGTAYESGTHRSYSTVDLTGCPNLTHDSLMSVINNLYDLTGHNKNHQYLKLGATNTAKLSADEIAIATAKGWDVQ